MTSGSPRARAFSDRGFVVVKGLLPPVAVEERFLALERLSGRSRASFEEYRIGRGWLKRGVYRGWTLPASPPSTGTATA
jgi:hypothetical protein